MNFLSAMDNRHDFIIWLTHVFRHDQAHFIGFLRKLTCNRGENTKLYLWTWIQKGNKNRTVSLSFPSDTVSQGKMTAFANQDSVLIIKNYLNCIIKNIYSFTLFSKASFNYTVKFRGTGDHNVTRLLFISSTTVVCICYTGQFPQGWIRKSLILVLSLSF